MAEPDQAAVAAAVLYRDRLLVADHIELAAKVVLYRGRLLVAVVVLYRDQLPVRHSQVQLVLHKDFRMGRLPVRRSQVQLVRRRVLVVLPHKLWQMQQLVLVKMRPVLRGLLFGLGLVQ